MLKLLKFQSSFQKRFLADTFRTGELRPRLLKLKIYRQRFRNTIDFPQKLVPMRASEVFERFA